MSVLILRALTPTDEAAFLQSARDWEGEDPQWHSFLWKPGMKFADHLRDLENERAGRELKPGRVAHSMLYAFVDGAIVGRVSVRHTLNDFLLLRGGHIGYAVAPRYRRRGYAREMLKQALLYCQDQLNLERVLITCGEENTASIKLIEDAGGVHENTVIDPTDGTPARRYWVDL